MDIGTLVMTTQLILGLSLLVFVHELGHFLAAKMFGMRVHKFYIFFDAWGSKVWSKQIGETEYGIGWLPLGGYVQIAGMIDETQDKESLSAEPEEWEFRSKPAWQRFIVMIAGIVMNVITGIIIFAGYLYSFEGQYLPVSEVNKDGIYAHPAAQEIGLQTGDRILAINGDTPERFKETHSINVFLGSEITVDRNGQQHTVQVPDDFFKRMKDPFIGLLKEEVYIQDFSENSFAKSAGLQTGDRILSVNGQTIERFANLKDILKGQKDGQVHLQIQRDQKPLSFTSQVDSSGHLGFFPKLDYPYDFKKYDLWSSLKYGYKEGYELIASQIISFGMLFSGKLDVSDSVASPIGIARIYGNVWDWARFWKITGLLSFILAFMNILPIPALDGGHMLFIAIEVIIGRKLSDDFLEKAQIVGFVLLMTIMVFAFGNDIYKIFK